MTAPNKIADSGVAPQLGFRDGAALDAAGKPHLLSAYKRIASTKRMAALLEGGRGWATLPPMDTYSGLSAIFASRRGSFDGNNPNGMVFPRLDALADAAGTELDETKRRAMLTESLKIARDEALFIPMFR
jgi:peptide/nickel transport system substrate-binding protein